MDVLPCQKAIGKACFKAFPAFARRAIAYRLLHLLIPPDIAKFLPKTLKDPLIAPGVKIPLDAKFPPGTCIVPGCSFPAGWDPDEDPPECAKSAPLPTLAMIASGGNPNVFLAPGPSGPLPVPASPAPTKETVEVTKYAENDCLITNNQTTWNDTRNGSAGTSIFCDVGITNGMVQAWRGATSHQIIRYFFSVDLSTIPAGATITEVLLQLTSYGSTYCGVSVQRGTQQDSMTTGDFDEFTGNYFAEIDWASGVNQFSFNQTGLDFMTGKVGAMAKVCLKEYDHDYGNIQPAVNDLFQSGCRGPSTGNDADKPQFIITYEH